MSKNEKHKASRRVNEAREIALAAVIAAYPDIVNALIEQAKSGSCPHAKLVFELMDPPVKRAAAREDDEEEPPSLVEYLIEQLQLKPPPDHPGAAPASPSAA